MNKKLITAAAIVSMAAAGAFAQIGLGVNAALYSDTGMSLQEFGDQLHNGEGVFYGPFIELGMDKLALGLSGNFSFYNEDWSYNQNGSYMMAMMDYDISLYVQGHFLGYKSLLDPFLEMGFGVMGKDYANSDDDPDPDNPIMATKYWEVGGGLGVNFGPVGIYLKGLYLFPFGTVDATYQYWDGTGWVEESYALSNYDVKRLKLELGAKIIL
jgi:hypothetical protein